MALKPKHTVKMFEGSRELLMSFGLLNDITALVVEPLNVPRMLIDVDLREAIVKELFAERTKTGRIEKEISDIYEVEADAEQIEAALEWAMEHVMDFFVRSLKKGVRVGATHLKAAEDLRSLLDGLESSASKTA